MEKLIWKADMSQDFLLGLPDEQLRDELIDLGYEPEMIDGLNHEGLHELVKDDYKLLSSDKEDFETRIAPMIEKQTLGGIVLLAGLYGVEAIPVEDLIEDPTSEIYDDGDGLALDFDDGRGPHKLEMYAIPEDSLEMANFVLDVMGDFKEEEVDFISSYQGEDKAEEIFMNSLPEYLTNPDTLEEWVEVNALREYGTRIKNNLLGESLAEDTEEYYVLSISDMGGNSDYIKGPMTKEEATDYAKILRKNASKYYKEKYLVYPKNRIPGRYKHLLSNESLQESISLDEDLNSDVYKALSDVAFDYEVMKEEPVYKDDFEEAEEYFNNKFFGDLSRDDLDEAITIKDQDSKNKLADEVSQLERLDIKLLYNLDLFDTELSDGSIEKSFPLFTKLIISFLQEEAGVTDEELEDKDQINDWWVSGDLISGADWPTLFEGARLLINSKDRIQWKNIYKNYYKDVFENLNTLDEGLYDDINGRLFPVYVVSKYFPQDIFTFRETGEEFLGKELPDHFKNDDTLRIVDKEIIEVRPSTAKGLHESLNPEQKKYIQEVCDEMILNIDPETLKEILDEPALSEEGLLANDEFYDEILSNVDENEIVDFAKDYFSKTSYGEAKAIKEITEADLNEEVLEEEEMELTNDVVNSENIQMF